MPMEGFHTTVNSLGENNLKLGEGPSWKTWFTMSVPSKSINLSESHNYQKSCGIPICCKSGHPSPEISIGSSWQQHWWNDKHSPITWSQRGWSTTYVTFYHIYKSNLGRIYSVGQSSSSWSSSQLPFLAVKLYLDRPWAFPSVAWHSHVFGKCFHPVKMAAFWKYSSTDPNH